MKCFGRQNPGVHMWRKNREGGVSSFPMPGSLNCLCEGIKQCKARMILEGICLSKCMQFLGWWYDTMTTVATATFPKKFHPILQTTYSVLPYSLSLQVLQILEWVIFPNISFMCCLQKGFGDSKSPTCIAGNY